MTAGVEGDTRQIEVHFIRRADVDDVRSFAAEEILEVRVSPALETEQILQLTRRAGKTLGTASKNGYYIGPDLRMPLGVMAADAACPGDGDAKVRPAALSPFDQLFDLPGFGVADLLLDTFLAALAGTAQFLLPHITLGGHGSLSDIEAIAAIRSNLPSRQRLDKMVSGACQNHAQQSHAHVESVLRLSEVGSTGVSIDLLGVDLVDSGQGMHDDGM